MNKLELFRTIGEAHAKSVEFVMGPLGERKVDYHSERIFVYIAREMYPFNEHRYEWALANMTMFYTQECERQQIMGRLQGKSNGSDLLARIRKRNEEIS